MGKALYRQYRPTSLQAVVGQKHITDTLENAVKKGLISHAYLFTGPRGVGKTSIARILAHAINDLPYDEASTHLDIIEIDAASNRRIDEIRNLRDKVHIAPTSARYKVYIIDEVHMLTREAFNALLKTLEEPPAHAVFILATTELHKVPETIVSRTQRYSFKPIEKSDVVAHLRTIADKEKLKITDEALELLAEHGRGSFRDSISMLDQIAGVGEQEITRELLAELLGVPRDDTIAKLLEATAGGDMDGLFTAVQQLREQGAHPATIAQTIIARCRDQLVSGKTVLDGKDMVNLMKSMLPLTGVHSGYEALEIALLDAVPTVQSSPAHQKPAAEAVAEAQTSTKADPQTAVAEQTPNDIPKTQNEEEPKKQAPAEITKSGDDGTVWQTVLNAIKGHHNTLYGVLRMAEASVDEDAITLTFQFAFHKKQVTQSRHAEILQKTIKDVLEKPYRLELEVKAPAQKLAPKPQKPKASDALTSVSNIFGGAELLES